MDFSGAKSGDARGVCAGDPMAAPGLVRAMDHASLQIFSGNANPELACEICQALGMSLGRAAIRQFADGEVHIQIQENVRGADVFIIQPTCTPADKKASWSCC